jgi:hypothetical protein
MTSRTRALRFASAFALWPIAAAACAVDTSAPPPDRGTRVGDVYVRSKQLRNGEISAEVATASGDVLFVLSLDPTTGRVTARAADQDPVSFENPADRSTPEGAELAALYLYRHSLGLRDQPGCDPPANFMTTVCLSHMCAVHDQCYFDNPDRATHPCIGSAANFWVSVKHWAWGTADYCDLCNVDAIGGALKNGMYGCELSGECNGWACGCDAKECTANGSTVCLANGDCHQLENSAPGGG